METDQDRPWILDTTQWRLSSPSGEEILLTHAELDLLNRLLSRPGKVIRRDELDNPSQQHSEAVTPRTRLDVRVSRLRHRANDALGQLPLRTAYGHGYVWTAPAAVIGIQADMRWTSSSRDSL